MRVICRAMFGAALALAGVPTLLAAAPPLPALLSPASTEHHVGKVIFVELVTPNLDAAKQFYAGLFGWTYRDSESGGIRYSEASMDGRPVAGMIHRAIASGEHRQPSWLSFMAVRDVDATKAVAVQQGAKVLFEPQTFPDRGREAIFADPQGAVFAVLASSSGDPPDMLATPGEWIWSSLITTDPDSDAAFYQRVFDYEIFDLSENDASQHLMFASDNYARASANTLPANRLNGHPHWLNFVHVEDTVAMAAKVVALGGRVLVEARPDRHGGRVAVVADPAGAAFGLLEWPENDTKEVSK
jgi:predicted enzyme related to lactoylglutathione lyase